MKGQQIVLCPHCGSNKVKSQAESMFLIFLIFGVVCTVSIVFILIGFGLIIGALVVRKSLRFRCVECKHDFAVNKGTFEEYQKYLHKKVNA